MAVRKSIRNRFYFIYTIIVIFFIMAVVRMFMIITVEREGWLRAAKRMERKNRIITPERGSIYSCNGELISVTMPYYHLYMDTRVEALHIKNGKRYKDNIDSLALCLSHKFKDKTPEQYKSMINTAYMNKVGRLKLYPRRVSYIDMLEVKKFPLFRDGRYESGFIPEEMSNRENLYGNLAGRTIGDIYGDGRGGQYGIELYYDSLLAGTPGEERGVRVGRKWVYVPVIAPELGCDIVTTIDVEMQDVCEKILKKKLEQIQAEYGCLVLMEVSTGEIKSMVNLGRGKDGTYRETWNMAVADLSEPGSTFKTVSMMVALENNVCDTSDLYWINHGTWKYGDRTMTDHNWRRGGYDTLSVSEILAYSSNVGTSRLIAENFANRETAFVEAVINSGFNKDLRIEIPGAAHPHIPLPTSKTWSKATSLPWMSIGYGVQIPPIYTLNFYNAIANNGTLVRPYLVKQIEKDGNVVMRNSPEVLKSSICKPSTLNKLKGMLEEVVEYGTAKANASKEFKIAGKTGTAQLYYGKGGVTKHQVSFCGYFPADKPLYSCIVVVKEPKMAPSAAFMSGAVFHDVAERVYSMAVKKHISSLERCQDKVLPEVKGGKRSVVEKAMKQADVDFERNAGDWVTLEENAEDMEFVENVCPTLDNRVPDVVGMGLSDAVYLMESAGLYVMTYGKGKVVRQSLRAGAQVSPGATVSLVLR